MIFQCRCGGGRDEHRSRRHNISPDGDDDAGRGDELVGNRRAIRGADGGMGVTCNFCKKTKPINQFYKRRDCVGYLPRCKRCQCEYARQWRLRVPNYGRVRYLRKYGLTLAQYRKMGRDQNGKCAICLRTQKRALAVDHHHESGRVRKLLCGSCNALIGMAHERTDILLAAIAYLDKHNHSGYGKGDGGLLQTSLDSHQTVDGE